MVHLFQPNVPIAIQEVIIIFVSEVCYGDNRKGQVLGGGRKEHGKTPIKTHLNRMTLEQGSLTLFHLKATF